jgi:PAS domain S-box-containing protein
MTIFGLYFVVTVIVTFCQLTFEYYHTKDGVTEEIRKLPASFGKGVTQSMWTFNFDLLQSILTGMHELSIVSGVKIENEKNQIVSRIGVIKDSEGIFHFVDIQGNAKNLQNHKKLFDELFDHSFPITYKDENNRSHFLGTWTVYSSQRIIIDRVKYGFFLIIINSIIKTLALWFIFFFIINRLLRDPLLQLKTKIERVDFNHLEQMDVSFKSNRNDELGMLEHSYDTMIHKLIVSRQSLDQLNQNLDSLVKIRTSELEKTNSKLKDSEKKYRQMFEDNTAIKLLIDPINGDIVDANSAAGGFYGYDLSELKKMKISDISTLPSEEIYIRMLNIESKKTRLLYSKHTLASGKIRDVEIHSSPISFGEKKLIFAIIHDISERKTAEKERETLIVDLQKALSKVKQLKGLLPICSYCKKIRDDKGYWNQIESYIHEHSEAEFSHSICRECAEKYYPDMDLFDDNADI